MSTTSDDIQAASSDTRPSMLDRADYESWAQRFLLYCKSEGEVMFEPERPRTYANLDYHEPEGYKADFRATLFLLEWFLKDIYMLINHIMEAKVIWNDIKMLMGDTRLTKDVCTRPEVQDPDNDITHVVKKHEVHEIHYEVQQTNVLDSNSADMGNSNIIPYEQCVKHNEGLVIPIGEYSVPNDAYVMHENSAYVPDDSFTTTLNIYKDQNKLKNKLYVQDQSIQTVHMMLKPKTLCDEHSEKDIIDPNPFHLKKAKTVQPTIYNGNEIFKPHHILVTVHDSEETLVMAETTGQKMSEKINDHECVAKRVKIIPPNYSKENFLATFTPRTQLTPEQVFWSLDLEKRKAKQLKANTPPLRKLAAATVYPPNTPAHLVLKTLPTKCKTVISIFVLNQLFADFDKTCTNRITPTGITERTSKDAPEFDAFFELNEKDAQLQTHRNIIRKLKAQISQLKANKSDVTGTFFPQPLES
nr:hypothetical protein [Tanacetum cinerariifolium]